MTNQYNYIYTYKSQDQNITHQSLVNCKKQKEKCNTSIFRGNKSAKAIKPIYTR